MLPHLIVPFALASVLLFLTPGPSMAVILANGAVHGRKAGLMTVLGNATGCAVLLVIVLAGLELLVRNFEAWFPYVRYAGAFYLFWLGISYLRRGVAPTALGHDEQKGQGQFIGGIVAAFANPAAVAFLAAFLPQFIDQGSDARPQFAWLALTFMAACLIVQAGLALMANHAGTWLIERNAALIHRIAAVVLIAGGLILIFARG